MSIKVKQVEKQHYNYYDNVEDEKKANQAMDAMVEKQTEELNKQTYETSKRN